MFVVRPSEVDGFVAALPVSKLFGVGKVTAARFESLGVRTCSDLRAWSLVDLHRQFGSFGSRLHALCRGIDDREVVADRERKSVSVETTYVTDLPTLAACLVELPALLDQLERRISRAQAGKTIRKLFVKIRFADFRQTTVECVGLGTRPEAYRALLEKGFARRGKPVRLLGVGVRTEQIDTVQTELFVEVE